jgi:hypothetical protein
LHKREGGHAEKAHKVGIFIDMIHVAEGLNPNVVFRKWLVGALEVLRREPPVMDLFHHIRLPS